VQFQEQGKFSDDFLRLWASFPFKAIDAPSGEFSLNEGELEKAVRRLPKCVGWRQIAPCL
jgi:hypothetical protein